MPITEVEQKTFGKFPLAVRQMQYAQAICKRKPGTSVAQLKESLVWKFGRCELSTQKLTSLAYTEK